MKLRNRKTGKIGYLIVGRGSDHYVVANDEWLSCGEYDSLAELNEEWCDYEEPKEYWFMDYGGRIKAMNDSNDEEDVARKEIGNYFDTREEAEKAVERLRAWKRLKKKGFKFDGWEDLQAEMSMDDLMLFNRDVLNTDNIIGFRMDDYHDCIKDLNICFGGEE